MLGRVTLVPWRRLACQHLQGDVPSPSSVYCKDLGLKPLTAGNCFPVMSNFNLWDLIVYRPNSYPIVTFVFQETPLVSNYSRGKIRVCSAKLSYTQSIHTSSAKHIRLSLTEA